MAYTEADVREAFAILRTRQEEQHAATMAALGRIEVKLGAADQILRDHETRLTKNETTQEWLKRGIVALVAAAIPSAAWLKGLFG